MGLNSHQDLCNLLAKVHRTFFTKGRRNRSGKISFQILDILSRSGDIHDQIEGCIKSTEILHVFGPQIFWGEGPPNFFTWIIKFRQFPIMWQVSRRSAEGSRRTRGERIKK